MEVKAACRVVAVFPMLGKALFHATAAEDRPLKNLFVVIVNTSITNKDVYLVSLLTNGTRLRTVSDSSGTILPASCTARSEGRGGSQQAYKLAMALFRDLQAICSHYSRVFERT